MADDVVPDIARQLLQRQSSQGQGGGVMYVFGARETINVGAGLSLQSAAPKAEGTFRMAAQKREGLFAKLLADMGFKSADFVKGFEDASSRAPVREASQAELFGQGGPSGGYASMVSGPSGSGLEIG
ncbi:MAG: hypothetical protein SFW64_04960 [Alphaproteobacteria bacterium]|nr:hypothetical protein [Alphaproteobacteria bacterium]